METEIENRNQHRFFACQKLGQDFCFRKVVEFGPVASCRDVRRTSQHMPSTLWSNGRLVLKNREHPPFGRVLYLFADKTVPICIAVKIIKMAILVTGPGGLPDLLGSSHLSVSTKTVDSRVGNKLSCGKSWQERRKIREPLQGSESPQAAAM